MKRKGLFHAENLRPVRFTGMELLSIHSWAEIEALMAQKFMDEDDRKGRPADPRLGFKPGEKFEFFARTVKEAMCIRDRIERHIGRCTWPATIYTAM